MIIKFITAIHGFFIKIYVDYIYSLLIYVNSVLFVGILTQLWIHVSGVLPKNILYGII